MGRFAIPRRPERRLGLVEGLTWSSLRVSATAPLGSRDDAPLLRTRPGRPPFVAPGSYVDRILRGAKAALRTNSRWS